MVGGDKSQESLDSKSKGIVKIDKRDNHNISLGGRGWGQREVAGGGSKQRRLREETDTRGRERRQRDD